MVPEANDRPVYATASTLTRYPYTLLQSQQTSSYKQHTQNRGKGEGDLLSQMSTLRIKDGEREAESQTVDMPHL